MMPSRVPPFSLGVADRPVADLASLVPATEEGAHFTSMVECWGDHRCHEKLLPLAPRGKWRLEDVAAFLRIAMIAERP